MRRREFITLLGGAAAAWPLAARAQQGERMRRIGVLMPAAADDPEAQARIGGVPAGAAAIGLDRRPQRADRYSLGRRQRRRHSQTRSGIGRARAGCHPGHWRPAVAPLLQATRTVPIVFVIVADPVGAGFVDSLARPGGNATGFMTVRIRHEREMAGAAQADRAGRDASGGPSGSRHRLRDRPVRRHPGRGAVARGGGEPGRRARRGRDRARRRGLRALPNGGLIVTASALADRHRELIIALAARHKLPAVYSARFFVAAGGLISYGPDQIDQFRRAAGYVDRILKGEKPADLPVQAPTKYELVINLKTAKALGLDRAAVAARPRRRGDRMSGADAAIAHERSWHDRGQCR